MTLAADLEPVFVCGFGRPGMQFLHALFDGHPQVLIIPAILKFHLEWERNGWENLSAAELVEAIVAQRNFSAELSNEVVAGLRVDHDSARSYHVDRERFVTRFRQLLEEKGTGRGTVFTSLHEAYAFAAGIDLNGRKILVENAHGLEQIPDILSDFPNARVIVLIREPKAAFASCMQRYNHTPFSDPGRHYADLIAAGFVLLNELRARIPTQQLKVVRAEDLNTDTERVMRDVAHWTGIDFSSELITPTRAGQGWIANSNHQDPIAAAQAEPELWASERIMMDWLTANSASAYGYASSPPASPLAVLSLAAPSRYQLWPTRRAPAGANLRERIFRLRQRTLEQAARIASLLLLPARLSWLHAARAYHQGRLPHRSTR